MNLGALADLVKKPIQKAFYDKTKTSTKYKIELPRNMVFQRLVGVFMSSADKDGNSVSKSNSYIEYLN